MIPLLELQGINKVFCDDFLLEDINLSLHPGKVHVVVGANGSGKSALLRIISGLFAPDSGQMLLDGRPVSFENIAQAKGAGILYRPQEPQLFDNLSVAENLFFDCLPRRRFGGFDTVQLRAQTQALLAGLGIRLDPGTPAGRLGYAQRQLLEAAKTRVGSWKIVAFDEPTAALAEPERELLFSIVRSLRDQGVGVIYVSHRLDEILKIGDTVSVVRQGRIADTRIVADMDKEDLVRMMTGRLLTERYPRFSVPQGKKVLEVKGLASSHILSGVDFCLHHGEILGITGLMGSGRSRLAQCLFGAVAPSAGTILLDGKPVYIRSPKDALDLGIALVPEDRVENSILHRQDLVLNLTVASLSRFRGTTGLDSGHMFSLVQDYSDRIGLGNGRPGDFPDLYSGGNQQKVSIARWLAKRSRIYILDEPTRGIDASSKVDVYNAIADIAVKGGSVLLISSDIEEILGMCDRVLVLTGGRIVCDLPRLAASQELILEYATAEE